VRRLRHARRGEVTEAIDLGFSAERWQRFVVKPRSEHVAVDRRALEVCVFVHLAAALQGGDVYVVGSGNFAEPRPAAALGGMRAASARVLRRAWHA
jgi:hypothetical protein